MTTRPLGSTYRLQLQGLGFEAARGLVAYLSDLGIGTLYVSPVLQASTGSTHGYDVVDPCRLDPALGSRSEFDALLAELEGAGMRMLIDIVPNHMAATEENLWWWDLLRSGRESEHADTFDIDWESHGGRVLLPTLSAPLGEVCAGARIGDGLLEMDDKSFPLRPDDEVGAEIAVVLGRQHYRPSYWRLARDELNYRRFFDIDSLVGVRVEDPAVFERTHRFVLQLCSDRRVAGVRVDHVDGLADPAGYLRRLGDALSGPTRRPVVLVEKILARDEVLPGDWATDGTTGYEFADLAGGLFVDGAGAAEIADLGEEMTGEKQSFAELALSGKAEMLDRSFRTELKLLTRLALAALERSHPGHDLSGEEVRAAIAELTVRLDVYRTYLRSGAGPGRDDRRRLRQLAENCELSSEAARALGLVLEGLCQAGAAQSPWLRFAQRWQQLSGADMAKGVEDTASYRYSGLLSHAEVGCDPDRSSVTPEEFARFLTSRRARPSSLNATSTHDSKRNEDARARLYALSEASTRWSSLVRGWHRRYAKRAAPDAHDELLVYQSLFALWPFGSSRLRPELRRRLEQYVVKAAREAKVRTSWTDPDTAYEAALVGLVRRLARDKTFSGEMERFVRRLGAAAATNSLALTVLKCVAPGVPDFYQGTEVFAPSLTDPDNRRPVDWEDLGRLLGSLPAPGESTSADLAAMVSGWPDGRLKLHTIRALLQLRRENPELFDAAPAQLHAASGPHADKVVALGRRHGRRGVIAVIPRLTLAMCPAGRFPTGGHIWGDTTLRLPAGSGQFRDILSGKPFGREEVPRIGDILGPLPVAVLISG